MSTGTIIKFTKSCIVKLQSQVQTSVLGLGVDFVLPLSQQQEQEEPPPKYMRRKCIRSLKIVIYTTHGLLPDFRGLGVHGVLSHFVSSNFKDWRNLSAFSILNFCTGAEKWPLCNFAVFSLWGRLLKIGLARGGCSGMLCISEIFFENIERLCLKCSNFVNFLSLKNVLFRCDETSRNTLYTGQLLTYLLTYLLT